MAKQAIWLATEHEDDKERNARSEKGHFPLLHLMHRIGCQPN